MKKAFLLLVLLLFIVPGCGRADKATFTKENYPRVDGSTVTIPLSEAMASRLLNMDGKQAASFVKHYTTHDAYVNLVAGKADIILVTEPSDEELALARAKNIELEVVPVVKDAFVFLANVNNPVESLTVEQIQGIYQGKIKNWKEAGGPDKEIIPYQRPKNSGSQTNMESIVMKGLTMMDPPREMVPAGMGDLIERVAGYNNSDRALGYSVYYFAKTMYSRDTIKILGVNGVKPEKSTITANKYPFTISYYAVIKKSEPAGSPARKLLQWLLGKDGQSLAESAGYVPLK